MTNALASSATQRNRSHSSVVASRSRLLAVAQHSLLMVALAVGVSACGGKSVEKPAKLVSLKNSVSFQRLWSRSVGDGDARARLQFAPAIEGERLYASAENGRVTAVDANTGKQIWRTSTKLRLMTGPGASDRLVVVAADEGQVQALDAADGKLLWNAQMSSEVLATPAVYRDWVLVRTNDNALVALSAVDGQLVWVSRQSTPRLTMRGSGAPVISQGKVYAGFDNGRVVAAAVRDGETQWEATIAVPQGRGDLERMVDVDSRPKVADSDVYAVAFQGRVASIAAESGRVLWTRDVSSVRDVDVLGDVLFVTNTRSEVMAFDRYSSNEIWAQKDLKLRGLTGPVAYSKYVIVGDYKGYLHILDPDTGNMLARFRVGSDPIVTTPIVVNDVLYVQSSSGKIAAYKDPNMFAVPEGFESQIDRGFSTEIDSLSPSTGESGGGLGGGFGLE